MWAGLPAGKCSRERWSFRQLQRQLSGALFERVALSPVKLSTPLAELHPAATSVFKDNYLIEFLGLPKGHSEADLHDGLVAKLKQPLFTGLGCGLPDPPAR